MTDIQAEALAIACPVCEEMPSRWCKRFDEWSTGGDVTFGFLHPERIIEANTLRNARLAMKGDDGHAASDYMLKDWAERNAL